MITGSGEQGGPLRPYLTCGGIIRILLSNNMGPLAPRVFSWCARDRPHPPMSNQAYCPVCGPLLEVSYPVRWTSWWTGMRWPNGDRSLKASVVDVARFRGVSLTITRAYDQYLIETALYAMRAYIAMLLFLRAISIAYEGLFAFRTEYAAISLDDTEAAPQRPLARSDPTAGNYAREKTAECGILCS